MRKIVLLVCLSCIILSIGIWFYPIFKSVDEEDFYIMEYADDDNIAVVCEIIDATDAYWIARNSSDPNFELWPDRGFDATGNVPSKILKYPMYYYKSKFIFVGNFTENKINVHSIANRTTALKGRRLPSLLFLRKQVGIRPRNETGDGSMSCAQSS